MPVKPLAPSISQELRAIQWFTVSHLAGVLLFMGMMAGFFWYLHTTERDQERQALYRDIEWAQQSLRLKWRENQDEVMAAAPEWALGAIVDGEQATAVRDFLSRNPEILYVAILDAQRKVRWLLPSRGVPSVANRTPGQTIDDSAGYASHLLARNEQRTVYSAPFLSDDSQLAIELHSPFFVEKTFGGTVVVGYSLQRMLSYSVPKEVRGLYQISIVDQGGNTLVSSSPRTIHDANLSYELPLDPPGHGIRLRAHAFEANPKFLNRTLLAAVALLSLASVISLFLLWRHARRRLAAEGERDRLFALSLDLMAIMRQDGTFVRVNPALDALLGGKSTSARLIDLVHPEDRPNVHTELTRLDPRGPRAASPYVAEFEARFGSGEKWRWIRWSIRGDPDRPRGALYAVAHDTTERKLAETTLAAETAFRRAMEDSMLTGMRAFDMNGRITFVNPAFCRMLGYEEHELLGTTAPYPYWPPGLEADHNGNLQMVLAGKAPRAGFETRVRRKDGQIFDARMYVSPLVDSAGNQTGWMTSMTDITEPKRIREELAAAHERFTTVLDELDAAVSVVESGDAMADVTVMPQLLFANRFYRRMFGPNAAGHVALLGGRSGFSSWTTTEVYSEHAQRWFDVRTRDIRWVDGRPVRMLVATDVTRRREAEERQRLQDNRLQRTARLVTMGEMASSLAHELNQPLTAIANYCMGLSARVKARLARGDGIDAQELLEMLSKTSSQAERAGMVIRRIRNFVKRSEPERRSCEVEAIVADAMGLAEIDARRHGVIIDVDLPEHPPTLHADPILIEQVLLNLMKNGIESMLQAPRRNLKVSVTQRGASVEFAVADTGSGLAPGVQEKLFEPFYTTKHEGMGIGLNICRSIVESHQGRLWAESNPEGGCTFRFTLALPDSAVLQDAA